MGWLKIQKHEYLKNGTWLLQSKKILNLCLRWHILQSYCFLTEATFQDWVFHTEYWFVESAANLMIPYKPSVKKCNHVTAIKQYIISNTDYCEKSEK